MIGFVLFIRYICLRLYFDVVLTLRHIDYIAFKTKAFLSLKFTHLTAVDLDNYQENCCMPAG